MFKVRVIPCLDVKDGRVVKGINFVNLRDAGDPVAAAIAYDAAGADELTFLDITASHENRDTIFDVVTRTAEACFMPLTVGGGVRTVEDIRKLLKCGADKVSINTAAVNKRAFVKEAAEKFGDQCIVVAIDAKKVSQSGEPDRWEIFTHGGRNPAGIDAIDYAREVVALGAGASPEQSYTRKLIDKGIAHCAKKLGEEAVETALAAVTEDREHLIGETADLLYHLLVVLEARGVKLAEVEAALAVRTAQSGLD